MKIGEMDNVLYITERSILRMRDDSALFRVCWGQLLGCYNNLKHYMDYVPELVRGKSEDNPIILEAGPGKLGHASGSSQLDREVICAKIGSVEKRIGQLKHALSKPSKVANSRASFPEVQGVLLFLSGPDSKNVVRGLINWHESLLAIWERVSRGGRKYFFLVVDGAYVDKTILDLNGMLYEGKPIFCEHAQDRGLNIDYIIMHHGGIFFLTLKSGQ